MGVGTALAAMLCACFGTVILMPIVVRVMRAKGMFDIPNFRSSHEYPVVRGGGVAVCLAATVVLAIFSEPSAVQLFGYAGVLGFALLGLSDDVGELSAMVRLAVQLPLGLVVALPASGAEFWLIVGGLFVVCFVNSFNFMDGIDGISAGTGLVAGAAIALMSSRVNSDLLLILGIVIASVSAGFLPFNIPKARAFLGDSGSYFLGSLIAFSMLVAIREGVHPLLALSPSFVYAFDTSVTLLKRVRAGKQLTESHREHIYQLITVNGRPHWVASTIVGCASCLIVGASLLLTSFGPIGTFAGLVAAVVVLLTYSKLPEILDEPALL